MAGVRWTAALLGAVLAAPQLSAQGFIVSHHDPHYGFPTGRAYHPDHFGLVIGGVYNPYFGVIRSGYGVSQVTVVIPAAFAAAFGPG